MGEVTQTSDGSIRIRWDEPESGSCMIYDSGLAWAVDRVTFAHDVWALFDELLESIEEAPLP